MVLLKYLRLILSRKQVTVLVTVVILVLYYTLYSGLDIHYGLIRRRLVESMAMVSAKHTSTTYSLTSIDGKLAQLASDLFPKPKETDDRIVKQFESMEVYRKLRQTTEYRQRFGRRDNSSTMKYILRVGDFNWEDWIEGQQRFIGDKCPISDCWLTSEENRKKTADALLISVFNKDFLPNYLPKPEHQIWIAQHKESPLHSTIQPSALRGLANWTVSYRHESTVVLPYLWFYKIPGGTPTDINYAAGKKKKVAWFVSNCNDRSGRKFYADELAKFIDVDIYGGCGPLKCDKPLCRPMLKTDYKFYLAFENSCCVEYITEKLLWQALPSDVLPIVYGARPEDYARVAPPGSVIHVDDFSSPRELAAYLHLLDKNDTLYNEFFKWKGLWELSSDPVLHTGLYWCRLCMMLHLADDVGYVNWFEDYTDWWNGACNARTVEGKNWKIWRSEVLNNTTPKT